MNKTPYLRIVAVGIGFGLIAIFVVWTLEFWQNSMSGASYLCEGKGACETSLFYCPTFKRGPVSCSFPQAFAQYANFTVMAVALLPRTLTHPNLYFYVFYGTIAVTFLAQLSSHKIGVKWEKHLKNHQS